MIKVAPFLNQSFFSVIDVTDAATLLQNAPDRVVNLEVRAVGWPTP